MPSTSISYNQSKSYPPTSFSYTANSQYECQMPEYYVIIMSKKWYNLHAHVLKVQNGY
jgi:hypothetical protein